MMAKLINRINYPALLGAIKSIGVEADLPTELPSDTQTNSALLKKVRISCNF